MIGFAESCSRYVSESVLQEQRIAFRVKARTRSKDWHRGSRASLESRHSIGIRQSPALLAVELLRPRAGAIEWTLNSTGEILHSGVPHSTRGCAEMRKHHPGRELFLRGADETSADS